MYTKDDKIKGTHSECNTCVGGVYKWVCGWRVLKSLPVSSESPEKLTPCDGSH